MMKKLLFLFVFVIAALAANAQWEMQNTNFPQIYTLTKYIHAVDQNTVWATSEDGNYNPMYLKDFTRTNDGGATWTAGVISGWDTYGTSMVFALDYNTAWIPLWDTTVLHGTGAGGAILKTTDGGATWVHQSTAAFSGTNAFPNDIYFWNANDGWCMGDPNGGYFEIYTTTDGGDNWVRVPQANIPNNLLSEAAVTGFFSAIGNTVWFTTDKGRIYKSLDKGLNWTVKTVSSSLNGIQADVSFISATHGVVIHQGNSGTTATAAKWETFDGGTTWSLISQSGPQYTLHTTFVPALANTMVASGASTGNMGIAYSFDGGHNWTDFDDTVSNYAFLSSAWVDGSHGWSGHWTDADGNGGIRKYMGVLTQILNIDPQQGGAKIYPNPSHGQFTCAIIGFENKDVNITIYNAVGQKVYDNTVNQSLISYNQQIDLSVLRSGVYIAQIQSGKKMITEKLSIQ